MPDHTLRRSRSSCATTGTSGAALDQRVLAALVTDLGDPFVRETAQLYLGELDDRMTAVSLAAAAGALPELAAAAHTLKSTSALLGLACLADCARSVEHAARSGARVPVEEFRLDHEAARARAALAAYLGPGDDWARTSQTMEA